MKTLLLIDANSLIHRSFHALPPLTTPGGASIQAIYGLALVFMKLWRDEKPAYAAALFDRPEPTFRKKEYEAYKAHRPAAPDTLISQIIEAHEFFKHLGVPTFEIPGFEADDLIATLAEKFKGEKDVRVVILTGDLDTLQLVEGEKVVVRTFKKGISDTTIYDEEAVKARYGLSPQQMPDYKALVGDPSDNIRGVAGIGPKTATGLLQKYGTLDSLYAHVNEEKKAAARLLEGEKDAELSKHLVVLRRDAPLPVKAILELEAGSGEELKAYFGKLGFESLVKRLGGEIAAPGPLAKKSEAPHGAQGARTDEHICIVSVPEYRAAYASELPKVGFELKRALKELHERNKDLRPPYVDLGVAFWLIDPDLKDYSPAHVFKRFLRSVWTGSDADYHAAYSFVKEKLKEFDLVRVMNEIEMPLLPILAEMERTGIRAERETFERLEKKIDARLRAHAERIYKEAGREFNLNSPKQLAEVLAPRASASNMLKRKTPGGKISTSAESLEAFAAEVPLARYILEYREDFKIQSTYVRPLKELIRPDGRIHTEYIQTGAATGRLSSREPNLQNVPRESVWSTELRSAFHASEGYALVAFDYSQIELRILAELSGDERLKDAFRNNLDVHRITAAKIFNVAHEKVDPEMRRIAKTLNFGLIYGMGVNAFARTSGLSRSKATEFVDTYFKEFSRVREWQETVKSEARTRGFVTTRTGRRRNLLGLASGAPRVVGEAERAAVNQPIQGYDADLNKEAMIRVKAMLLEAGSWNTDAKMLLTIHDELLFEVRRTMINEISARIARTMEQVGDMSVPLRVDISAGENWGALAPLALS